MESIITVKGKQVSKMFGTYLGYIDFDSVRYWDHRYFVPFKIQIEKQQDNEFA